jgi:hypothetical protein
MDRMITIKLGHYDRETEAGITAAKSNLPLEDASRIVELVRCFRTMGVHNFRPTIRACIMIARITALRQARARADDLVFREVCRDVLCCDTIKITHDGESVGEDRLEQLIEQTCGTDAPLPAEPDLPLIQTSSDELGQGGKHHARRKKKSP